MGNFADWNPEKRQLLFLRTILRFIAIERNSDNQDDLAKAAGMSKALLIRFMNGSETKKNQTTTNHARKIAPAVRDLCHRDLIHLQKLAPVRSLIFDLFADLEKEIEEAALTKATKGQSETKAAADHPSRGIIKNQRIRDMVLPIEASRKHHALTISSLQGLWLLVRPATDGVGTSGESGHDERYSVSLLNLLSQDLEKGSYPYFKVRQGGDPEKDRAPLVFEGVVVPQEGRAVFVGALQSPERLFAMTASYDLDHDTGSHLDKIDGVMLGITSQKFNVASPHICLFIPGTDKLTHQEFEARYEALKNQIGARKSEPELLATFGDVGLQIDTDGWAKIRSAFRAQRSFKDD